MVSTTRRGLLVRGKRTVRSLWYARVRPEVLLALAAGTYADSVFRHFRRLGLEVKQAQTAAEAQWLAQQMRPTVIVLATDLPDDTGWLTCARITRDIPGQRVVLVERLASMEGHNYA